MQELKGKDIILLMGPTGSGKSTAANSMISGADSIKIDKNNECIPLEELKWKGVKSFEVSNDATGCTDIPRMMPLDDDH